MIDFIRETLDPIATVISIVTALPIFWTWWSLTLGRQRRYRLWFESARKSSGKLPAVLIFDYLAGKNIRVQVERFLASHETLKEIPPERVFYIGREKTLQPEDMPAVAQEIRAMVAEVWRTGTDELHLFLAGPLAIAALVGAELANSNCRIHFYQNHMGSTYVDFGPLRHPTFL
ncbi:MAG: hypothetical protein N2441_04665 [Rhodocyclaceae bacterium]|nr:hypothetical protein [Rhodocyclaceae bacterium]